MSTESTEVKVGYKIRTKVGGSNAKYTGFVRNAAYNHKGEDGSIRVSFAPGIFASLTPGHVPVNPYDPTAPVATHQFELLSDQDTNDVIFRPGHQFEILSKDETGTEMSAALADWDESRIKEKQAKEAEKQAKEAAEAASQRKEEREREAKVEREKFEATARRVVLVDGEPTQMHSRQVFSDVQKASFHWSLAEWNPDAFRGEAGFRMSDNEMAMYEVSLLPDGNATMLFKNGTVEYVVLYEGQVQYRVLDDKTIGFFIGTLSPDPDCKHPHQTRTGWQKRYVENLFKGRQKGFEEHLWGAAATYDLQ